MLVYCFSFSQNPIIKNKGVSDPHIRVFNDTLYLYSGHDASPHDKTWVMKDWRVFSSTNLTQWRLRETISPKDNFMNAASEDCWAGDAASRNGKYYFYFSDRKRGIGVMTSNTPYGPFKDPLQQPLVAPMHDPTIFIDDDAFKTPYLIYGDKANGNGFHIVRLKDTMVATAEPPKRIEIQGKAWQNAPHWMDKNYLFKKKGIYYLSWGRDYAISQSIYGPYTCVGAVGEGHHLNEFAHGSFFDWKGQFYHIWCFYVKKGFKYRTSIITYCHIDDKGHLVTDTKFLDAHYAYGVGRYNAAWDTIEAEWYYEVSEGIKKTGDGSKGFVLSNIKNGSWIRFANLTFDTTYKMCLSQVQYQGKNGHLELRIGSPNGRLIGETKLKTSHGFKSQQMHIEIARGTYDIYLVFKGALEHTFKLDAIRFKQ